MPPEKRRWLDDRERLAPGEAARQEDEWEPDGIRCPPRFHLALVVEGQLFPEEEILDRQRCSRPKTRRHRPQDIDPDRGH